MLNLFRKNLYANYVGTIVQVLGQIISLPFYLSLLGPSQFGLVSFISTLQATLGLLEAGFAQVSAREFAVLTNKATPDYSSAGYYLRRFEKIYWGISITSAIVIACMSGFLANHWLQAHTESERNLSHVAVLGAALIFAVQFPSALYRSYLVGSQQQVKLSIISSTSLFARHGAGIVILWIHPTLYTYLIWQILSYATETFVRRLVSWNSVACTPTPTIEIKQRFTKVVRDSLGMFVAVIVGTITTQIDKIFLSGALPIEEFGYYSIASTVAIGVIAAIQPIVQAISPLMIQSANNKAILRVHSIKLAKMISVVAANLAAGYFFWGDALLSTWLRNGQAVNYIYPILSILLIGSALNAYYHIGYYNWLAHGKTKTIFLVNLISFSLAIFITPILIKTEGVMGATFGFVAMNLVGLVLSMGWIKKSTDLNCFRK
jgi:O-antigen/teichoic acid export membrane protein